MGNFSCPEIKIVSSQQINGANGAFLKQTNKIYLAREFLLANQSNIDIVAAVLLEEYGHYVDSELNSVDTPGDEGAIFSAVVRGEELRDSELQQLRNEDDSTVVIIDGEEIEIEQNIEDITLYSDSINFNKDGEFDFNFQTADYINRWTGSNIPNKYTYNSNNDPNNDLSPRFDFNEKTPNIGGEFNLGIAKVGANAGLRIHPGYFEAGLNATAEYNLGGFNFDFGSLQATVDAGVENNQLKVDIDTNITLPQFDYTLPYAKATLDAVLGYDFRVDGFLTVMLIPPSKILKVVLIQS